MATNRARNTETATDIEHALFLVKHIINPCEDMNGNNIRDFYIREAERSIETYTDENAKEYLRLLIEQHDPEFKQLRKEY